MRTVIGPGDGDPRHGTVNGYKNLGCRCEPCRQAWSVYCKLTQQTPCPGGCGRPAYGRYRPGAMCRECWAESRRRAEHGTESRYARGCRCEACRAASAAARRRRRHADPEASRAYDTAYHRKRRAGVRA